MELMKEQSWLSNGIESGNTRTFLAQSVGEGILERQVKILENQVDGLSSSLREKEGTIASLILWLFGIGVVSVGGLIALLQSQAGSG